MNQPKLALLVALLLAVPFALSSTSANAQGGDYKIGVVVVKDVFDAYERQEKEYEQLQLERDKKQKDIDVLSRKIEEQKERYDQNKATMSDIEREELEDEIQANYSRYKAEFKRMQEDIDRQEKRLLETIFEDINEAIQEVGARGNYHLILEGGNGGRSGVLYHSTTLNMTQQVTDHLNEKFRDS